MNILLLGKTDSIFVRDFCREILDPAYAKTVILTQSFSEEYQQDYKEAKIKEIRWPECFLKGIRSQLSSLFCLPRIWSRLRGEIGFGKKIDVFHVHYVECLHLVYFFPFWRNAQKRILTFWGSDIYSISFWSKKFLPFFLRKASVIVFMIPDQHVFFQSIYGNKYDKKVKVIDFGNSMIDELDKVLAKYTKEECKSYFHLPLDKVIVHIGYNASRAQQHLEVIESILDLPEQILDQIKMIISVAYKKDNDFEEYKEHLVTKLEEAKADYCFVDKYMQGEELAMFRRSCDLFIYGQKTDARSESPLEYIYGGAEFICPGWLAGHYEILDQAKARYYVYSDFGSLNHCIQLCLKDRDKPKGKISQAGRQKIRDEISWDSVRGEWKNLYADE